MCVMAFKSFRMWNTKNTDHIHLRIIAYLRETQCVHIFSFATRLQQLDFLRHMIDIFDKTKVILLFFCVCSRQGRTEKRILLKLWCFCHGSTILTTNDGPEIVHGFLFSLCKIYSPFPFYLCRGDKCSSFFFFVASSNIIEPIRRNHRHRHRRRRCL